MIPIETHKLIALAIYLIVVIFEWLTHGQDYAIGVAVVLGMVLLLILFDGLLAFFGSFGFMESFASDSHDGLSSNAVSVFAWCLFLIFCVCFVFDVSLY